MSYQVGQVLYIINSESTQVIPVQVVEQVTRKTLDGEKVTYIVKLPKKLKGAEVDTVPLDKIKGDFFSSSDKAKERLTSNALRNVERIIKNAENLSRGAFGESASVSSDIFDISSSSGDSDEIEREGEPDDAEVVILPDGTKAKVRLPKDIDTALANPVQKGALL
jgi:hypothetical protein